MAHVVFSLPLGVCTLWIHAGDTGGVGVRRQKSYLTLHTRTPHDEWMEVRTIPQTWARTTTFYPESPNVPTIARRDGPKFGSEDITAIPPFMYLWRAIKSRCLDREITPCLPTNKPLALGSSPLFIIHNLLWCQGQSDSIVTVKGKAAQPELSIRIENPDKQKNPWNVRQLGF